VKEQLPDSARGDVFERLASCQKREALKPNRGQGVPEDHKKVPLAVPLVRAFRDPALEVRVMELPPKNPEENYAISEYGGDSEGEDAAERDKIRQAKPIPAWCEGYFSCIQKQAAIDPDTIFGKVPRCVMEDVFPESIYVQMGKKRPARRRGSSGDWRRDRLTRSEIRTYKQRMGQKRSWDEPNADLVSSIA